MAKKVKSSFINMVLTLMVITVVAALALGGVYHLTLEPIAAAKKAARERAIKFVLPEFDSLITFKVAIPDDPNLKDQGNGDQDSLVFYQALNGTETVGLAVQTFSNQGYDPTQIQIMVGFLPVFVFESPVVT